MLTSIAAPLKASAKRCQVLTEKGTLPEASFAVVVLNFELSSSQLPSC